MLQSSYWKSIFTGIAGLAIAAMVSGPALAQVDGPEVTWRIALFGKPRAATAHLERMKEYIEAETDGKFSITLGYGTLGNPKEFLDLIKIGSVQGALIVASYTPGRLPLYNVMGLPFLPLGGADVQRDVYDALHADPRIQGEFGAWGAFPLMGNFLPPYELIGKGDEPTSLATLDGKRARVAGLQGKALENIGVVPTSLPAPEIYNAFDRGLVDLVALPHYAHVSYKSYEVGDWVTTNLGLGTIGFPTIINQDAWDALPEQYKELVNKAVEEGYIALHAAVAASDESSFAAYKEKGITLVELGDADLAKFRESAGKPVWDAWVAEQGQDGQEILDLVMEAAQGAMN
ncbi:MAG: TRAP transporter substrate-binding protein DctP [Paracoccaceae bacterium]